MKHADLLQLLREFYRDKSALRARHVAAARLVTDYDFNNAYQYVINREDVHLTWLHDAVRDHGGTPEDAAEPKVTASGNKQAAQQRLFTADRDQAQAFVDKWRDRVEHLTNARLRTMLRLEDLPAACLAVDGKRERLEELTTTADSLLSLISEFVGQMFFSHAAARPHQLAQQPERAV